ncbi:MAG: hypothetical protein AAF593_05970 [Planctomycetota bacterium]
MILVPGFALTTRRLVVRPMANPRGSGRAGRGKIRSLSRVFAQRRVRDRVSVVVRWWLLVCGAGVSGHTSKKGLDMAKAVVWGGMLIVALSGMFYGMKALNADPGEMVGYAIGAPDDSGECELQIVVTTMMNFVDGPEETVSPESTTPNWALWAERHFVVIDDATGQQIPFRKGGFRSKDISERQFGSAEVILLAKLDEGKTYTMHFIPNDQMPEKYVKQLTGGAKEFRRENFDPDY